MASVKCMTDTNLLARFGLEVYKVFLSSRGLKCSACLSTARVGYCWLSFQRRLNPDPLLGAQCRELKSILSPTAASNPRWDRFFTSLRERNFKRYQLAQ